MKAVKPGGPETHTNDDWSFALRTYTPCELICPRPDWHKQEDDEDVIVVESCLPASLLLIRASRVLIGLSTASQQQCFALRFGQVFHALEQLHAPDCVSQ